MLCKHKQLEYEMVAKINNVNYFTTNPPCQGDFNTVFAHNFVNILLKWYCGFASFILFLCLAYSQHVPALK